MEDGHFTLRIEETDVQAEFEDTIYTYTELFRQEQIELRYDSWDEITPAIPADPERLKQVFCNVLPHQDPLDQRLPADGCTKAAGFVFLFF